MLTIIFETNTEPKEIIGRSEYRNQYMPLVTPQNGDTVLLTVNQGDQNIIKEFIVTNRIIRYFIGNPNQEIIIKVREVEIPTHI